MRLLRFLSILAITGLVLAGCGSEEQSLDPPEINFGVDMSEMGMPVVDPRFTVATLPDGSDDWLLFDDIGEFLRYHQLNSSGFQVMWVPDFDTQDWIMAEEAYYVQTDEYCFSPMKWCVAAFASEERAEQAADEHVGTIWNWENVFDETWDQAPMSEGHSG